MFLAAQAVIGALVFGYGLHLAGHAVDVINGRGSAIAGIVALLICTGSVLAGGTLTVLSLAVLIGS